MLRVTDGHIQEDIATDCRFIGHWTPEKHQKNTIPKLMDIEDGEYKDLTYMCTLVGRDPKSSNDECYLFYCHDITDGPSDEIRLLKVESKVAARIFVGFFHKQFTQRICRHGTDYYSAPINDKGTKSKGS
jgi:hypothetical protein